MLTFDHAKLVDRQPREVKRLRRALMEGQEGQVVDMAVEHESDGSCCRREPWNATLRTIFQAVNPPARMVAVNLDSDGVLTPEKRR